MMALTYTLRLFEPLLAGGLDNREENSSLSLDYIPGSMVRGALCGRHFAAHPGLDAADSAVRRLFFGGTTRFLNAYPVSRQGKRSLPTPRSLWADKAELRSWQNPPKDIPKGKLRARNDATGDAQGTDKKALGISFVHMSDEALEPVVVKRVSITHNAREHRRTLKTKTETQVFSYEALDAEQCFGGVILGPANELTAIQKLLETEPDMTLGGSRSAGYGRVRVEDIRLQSEWSEAPASSDVDGRVVVSLLSDVIIRDAQGAFAADPGPSLGLGQALDQFSSMGLTGGFNRTWGLPLPQAETIEKGSVFVYDLPNDFERGRLAATAEDGIGLRREDGFGRIAVNWANEEDYIVEEIARQPGLTPPALSGKAADLAGRIVETAWRRQLEIALQAEVAGISVTGRAPASALSRVRLSAREAALKQSLDPIIALMDSMKKKATQSMEDVKVGRTSLGKWVRERCSLVDVDRQLKVNPHLSLGGAQATWTPALKAEFTARLIEGVVERKIKADR